MNEPTREPDPRLSEWLDGEMSPRDRDRFVAELRVNPQLRADLAAFQQTVETTRAALAATRAEEERSAADGERMAAAVLARLAAPRAAAANPRRWTASHWLLGGTLAAALLTAAVWIDRWGAEQPTAEVTEVADAGPALRSPEELQLGAVSDGAAVAKVRGADLAAVDPAAVDPAEVDPAEVDPAVSAAKKAAPEQPQAKAAPESSWIDSKGDPGRGAEGEAGAAMRFGGRVATAPSETSPEAADQQAAAPQVAVPQAAGSEASEVTEPPPAAELEAKSPSGGLFLQPSGADLPAPASVPQPIERQRAMRDELSQTAIERLPELRLQLPGDATTADKFRTAVAAESVRKAEAGRSADLTWSALVAEAPRTGGDDFYLGATRRVDSIDGWIVEGPREEVGALLGRLAELAMANGVILAQGEAALPQASSPNAVGAVGGGSGNDFGSGAAKPSAPGGPAGPATGGPGGPAPTGPGSTRPQLRGGAGLSADRGQPGLPRPGGGRGAAEGPQTPGSPAAGPSQPAPQPKAAAEGERMRVVVRLVPAPPPPPTDKR
ncbi:MAG: hypothetical protein RL398_3042 [Planctomycetota bacterium]